jgi:hypothetical protein
MAKDACTLAIREPWRRDKRKWHRPCGPGAAGLGPFGFDSVVPAACTRDQGRVKLHEKAKTEIEEERCIIAGVTYGDEAATQPCFLGCGL